MVKLTGKSLLLKKIAELQETLSNQLNEPSVFLSWRKVKGKGPFICGSPRVKAVMENIFLNSTELQEAFKADIMEFVTNHATVQTDLNVNPSLDIQHHDRNNVPAELPARLNLGSHKELCIWLSDEIWRSYKAKGGSKKRGQLIYGAEEFRPEDWPEDILPWSSMKSGLSKMGTYYRNCRLKNMEQIDFLKEAIKRRLSRFHLDPEVHVTKAFTVEMANRRVKHRRNRVPTENDMEDDVTEDTPGEDTSDQNTPFRQYSFREGWGEESEFRDGGRDNMNVTLSDIDSEDDLDTLNQTLRQDDEERQPCIVSPYSSDVQDLQGGIISRENSQDLNHSDKSESFGQISNYSETMAPTLGLNSPQQLSPVQPPMETRNLCYPNIEYQISIRRYPSRQRSQVIQGQLPALYSEIPSKIRKEFSFWPNCVMRKIAGTGGCLYGCIAHLLYDDESMFREIRRQLHSFLKDTWDLIGWAENIENQMPLVNLTTAGVAEPFSIQSVPEWLEFLQTERSLTTYTELEVESQNIANFFGITLNVFCYDKRTIRAARSDKFGNTRPGYWLTYQPMELVYQKSPYRGSWNLPYTNVVVCNEINPHFNVIVDRP